MNTRTSTTGQRSVKLPELYLTLGEEIEEVILMSPIPDLPKYLDYVADKSLDKYTIKKCISKMSHLQSTCELRVSADKRAKLTYNAQYRVSLPVSQINFVLLHFLDTYFRLRLHTLEGGNRGDKDLTTRTLKLVRAYRTLTTIQRKHALLPEGAEFQRFRRLVDLVAHPNLRCLTLESNYQELAVSLAIIGCWQAFQESGRLLLVADNISDMQTLERLLRAVQMHLKPAESTAQLGGCRREAFLIRRLHDAGDVFRCAAHVGPAVAFVCTRAELQAVNFSGMLFVPSCVMLLFMADRGELLWDSQATGMAGHDRSNPQASTAASSGVFLRSSGREMCDVAFYGALGRVEGLGKREVIASSRSRLIKDELLDGKWASLHNEQKTDLGVRRGQRGLEMKSKIGLNAPIEPENSGYEELFKAATNVVTVKTSLRESDFGIEKDSKKRAAMLCERAVTVLVDQFGDGHTGNTISEVLQLDPGLLLRTKGAGVVDIAMQMISTLFDKGVRKIIIWVQKGEDLREIRNLMQNLKVNLKGKEILITDLLGRSCDGHMDWTEISDKLQELGERIIELRHIILCPTTDWPYELLHFNTEICIYWNVTTKSKYLQSFKLYQYMEKVSRRLNMIHICLYPTRHSPISKLLKSKGATSVGFINRELYPSLTVYHQAISFSDSYVGPIQIWKSAILDDPLPKPGIIEPCNIVSPDFDALSISDDLAPSRKPNSFPKRTRTTSSSRQPQSKFSVQLPVEYLPRTTAHLSRFERFCLQENSKMQTRRSTSTNPQSFAGQTSATNSRELHRPPSSNTGDQAQRPDPPLKRYKKLLLPRPTQPNCRRRRQQKSLSPS